MGIFLPLLTCCLLGWPWHVLLLDQAASVVLSGVQGWEVGRKWSLWVNAVTRVTPTDLCLCKYLLAACRCSYDGLIKHRAAFFLSLCCLVLYFQQWWWRSIRALLLQVQNLTEEELFALMFAEKCPQRACPSVDNENHCPEETQRCHPRTSESHQAAGRIYGGCVRTFLHSLGFPGQLDGGTKSPLVTVM